MIIRDTNIKIAAGELFSAAFLDVFPQTQLVEVAASPLGFIFSAQVFQPIDAFAMKLVQERFAFLQRQPLTIEPIEMMRQNAATLLRHHGQLQLAQRAAGASQNIIPLVRIGNYYGYNAIEAVQEARGTGEIEILESEFAGENLSIHAAVCADKKEKKLFCKKYKEFLKNNHRIHGEKQQLFFESKTVPGALIWLKKGIALREKKMDEWKGRFEAAGYEQISFPTAATEEPALLAETARLYAQRPLRLADISANSIRGYHLCNREDLLAGMISSLQFLDQSINMLGIEYRYDLVVPREEILARALKAAGLEYTINPQKNAPNSLVLSAYGIDSLGREWKAAQIDLLPIADRQGNGEWVIKLAILAPLDWQIAWK